MDLIHVRAVSPPNLTARIVQLLTDDAYAVNVVVLRGVASKPDGDAIEFDLVAGAANAILRRLRELEIDRHGSIVIEPVELALSGPAARAEAAGEGAMAGAPVWEAVESRIRAQANYAPSFYLFLGIAGVIAAVGILTNSQILIVAAMVVGPEYGAIISVALGVDRRSARRIRRGMFALVVGFLLAIIATFAFSLLVRGLGLAPRAFLLGIRPVSNLIDTPNFYSFVVATLAGIVGVVALSEARAGALLGVFISVTTIPAAADIGVAGAFGSWSEASGSALQLLINVVVLVLVGFGTLRAQRWFWRQIAQRRQDRGLTRRS